MRVRAGGPRGLKPAALNSVRDVNMSESRYSERPGRYDFAAIEAKWQRYWEAHGTFRTLNPGEGPCTLTPPSPSQGKGESPLTGPSAWKGEGISARPKYYILDMFPYPSGAGLHVGHPIGYCATDIIARYKRMRGFNVLHPMGFDSFGLPAEQYAVETNVHPAITTQKNIEMYRRQLKMFGFSYDWNRELSTSDPAYYKFTQWMFVRMWESWFDKRVGKARPIAELVRALDAGEIAMQINPDAAEHARAEVDLGEGTGRQAASGTQNRRAVVDSYRLAYLADVQVNWCPALGTVLANEEVDKEGRSERGGHPVFRRPLRQWMLRITDYAESLLTGLAGLDWPEPIKLMQRNWIGKSTGAEVVFPLADCWRIEGGRWRHRNGQGAPGAASFDQFPDCVRVYTTRPDTLFGATYMVLAPEHPLVERIATAERRDEVARYVAAARNRSELDRTEETKEKTGVFTGGFAINPVTGGPIPIWAADYVLMGYGTGAIMAVPGGDTRDFEFASRFGLPIVAVVRPPVEWMAERVAALTRPINETARAGFERVSREFPDLSGTIAEHRRHSADLSEKTAETLRGRVGLERLAEHYVRHPEAWGEAFTGGGTAVNSPADGAKALADEPPVAHSAKALADEPPVAHVPGGSFAHVCDLNGLPTAEAKTKIIDWLSRTGMGRAAVNYKLRDWLFSRQRYWGEPFPVLHGEDGETTPIPEAELPLELPPMTDFHPTPMPDDAKGPPEPPLGRAKGWSTATRDGKRFLHDLNTMPNWAGSCWYYLRFIDPHNARRFCGAEAERYWMPVDLYVGGAEHAVLHLLYARFWHKVLHDLGLVSTDEPFQKLFNQGMIQSYAFRDARGMVVGPQEVEEVGEDRYVLKKTGQEAERIIAKMSKALKNVVNPDEVIAEFGADTFRLYEMYMGPLDASKPWNTRDVPGLFRLCQRIWRLVVDENTGHLSPALANDAPDAEALRVLHKTIARVSEELEHLKLNTAIAALFDFVNWMTPRESRPTAVIAPFVLLLAPFAPHLAEELWQRLGHADSLAYEPWPEYDEALARDEETEVGVQINGKMKARIMVAADANEKAIEAAALADQKVLEAVAGKTVRKVIVVKGRLVNIVAG